MRSPRSLKCAVWLQVESKGRELTDENSDRGGLDAPLRCICFIAPAQGSPWGSMILWGFERTAREHSGGSFEVGQDGGQGK